jgi:hypothetical protein
MQILETGLQTVASALSNRCSATHCELQYTGRRKYLQQTTLLQAVHCDVLHVHPENPRCVLGGSRVGAI